MCSESGSGRRVRRLYRLVRCATLHFISFVVDCLPVTVSGRVRLKITNVCLDEGYRADSRMLHRFYPMVRAFIKFHQSILRDETSPAVLTHTGAELSGRVCCTF